MLRPSNDRRGVPGTITARERSYTPGGRGRAQERHGLPPRVRHRGEAPEGPPSRRPPRDVRGGGPPPEPAQGVRAHLDRAARPCPRGVPVRLGRLAAGTRAGRGRGLRRPPAPLGEDTTVLLGGAALILCGFFPARSARERDFVLLFALGLVAILVLPLMAARAFVGDFDASVDVYSWAALAPQTSGILSLLGGSNTLHAVPRATAPR